MKRQILLDKYAATQNIIRQIPIFVKFYFDENSVHSFDLNIYYKF